MRVFWKAFSGLALVACAGSASAAQEDRPVESKTMAVSIPVADQGWTAGVIYYAQKQAKILEARFPGLKIVIKTSSDSISQTNNIEDLATQGMNALVTLPYNSDEITDTIRPIKAKGVFITVVDRALRDPIQDLYVAGNNAELGRVAGAFMYTQLDGKGDIIVIRGKPVLIDEQRVDAFNNVLKDSHIKIIDSQYGNWSRDDAFKIMQDFLIKHPQIDAVWCQDDDMAVGVLEAIKQARRTDVKFVLGGSGMKEMVKKIMDDDPLVPADVLYPPDMIATAMELTAASLYDKVPVRGSYILNATLISKYNAKNYYDPESPF